MTELLTICLWFSFETSDFIVDDLEYGWWRNRDKYCHNHQLIINLDNRPHYTNHRTQFMKRLTEFAGQYDREIVLAYYLPYHSKYIPIERCWEILENHWNGTPFNTVETNVEWAKLMTWKEIHPIMGLLETAYKKCVSNDKKVFQSIADRVTRHPSPPKILYDYPAPR